jgi:hypothetical protein
MRAVGKPLTCYFFGGAEGIRTPDPLHAMEVRYQLRYSPARPLIQMSLTPRVRPWRTAPT